MKKFITCCLTIPRDVVEGLEGDMLIQKHIQEIGDALKEQGGYSTVEYVRHELFNQQIDNDTYAFKVIYEVDTYNC